MTILRVVVPFALAAVLVVSAGSARGATQSPRLLASAPHGVYTWQIRPAQIVYTGDGSGLLRRLHWTTWTATEAKGSGVVSIDDCTPDCARGRFTAHAVKLVAFRPVRGHFTRLTLAYTYQGKREVDKRGIARVGGNWQYYIVGTR
jgi:hypothetical protein